jgi:hypothetical protein
MTTLAVNTPRDLVLGEIAEYPMIANDIIYEGAAVGLVKATGHARPLTSVDKFVGFADSNYDNTVSPATAAAINCRVISKGIVKLSVTGAVITDYGQPVYATDDNAFVFTPVGGQYIGRVWGFVSAGVVEVKFDAIHDVDPWEGRVREALAASTKTLDVEDSGKVICCTVTTVITLPATAVFLDVVLLNVGPFGTVQISASPNSSDKIIGCDLATSDNNDLINTLATACRGDFVHLKNGHTDGALIHRLKGTWAIEG